ncbi:MAG: hypothetical protein ABJB03_10290 [Rhodoglobus sp.]
MSTSTSVYQPGVCNIGPAEIRMRRQSGIIGAVVTVLALVAFVVFHVPDPWRLLVALPAGLGASGFLQAAFHFCARFGMSGLFNFGSEVGKTEAVHEQEYRRKDQRKAISILGLSLVAAAVVVVIAVLLP